MMSMQGLNASLNEPGLLLTQEDSIPMMYEVVVRKKGSDDWSLLRDSKDEPFTLGKVVTHLSLDDWCQLHGVKAELCGQVRRAFAGEKTDLI